MVDSFAFHLPGERVRRLLDLYCCEGGAGAGYAAAGFEVIGVDIEHQKRYPYEFVQGDAIAVLDDLLAGGTVAGHTLDEFDAIHASPPCQAYSVTRHSHGKEHPELVEPTRERLQATGKPYVIENVPGAPLLDPMILCGSMFGLGVTIEGQRYELRRHRLFESNAFLLSAGGCSHGKHVAGSYGGGRSKRAKDTGVRGGFTPPTRDRFELMGVDHDMTRHGLGQAIPPAYTEFIGQQLMGQLTDQMVGRA